MKHGFIKVAAAANEISVADTHSNTESIKELILKADSNEVNLLVLPELSITGYSCADLFLSQNLINEALLSLQKIAEFTKGKYPLVIVGLPVLYRGKLYNCAAVICDGKILGIVPKSNISDFSEFSEKRYFESASNLTGVGEIGIGDTTVPFGTSIIFSHKDMAEYTFGIEIGEDAAAPTPVSVNHCLAGAMLICSPSASGEVIGGAEVRRLILKSASLRQACGYIYSSAGSSESTQDAVFSGHALIFENGELLAENKPFGNEKMLVSEIDLQYVSNMRRKAALPRGENDYLTVYFTQKKNEISITRKIEANPFIRSDCDFSDLAETALDIQSYGLKKRICHAHSKKAVIGISGGLDSTLAILVAARTMALLGRPLTDIIAVTMPCFGTTSRTKSNAQRLCELLGVTFKTVDITTSVKQHFKDIGQDENSFDVTFENGQARERTQVLMDIANQEGGLVIGTGDLSELALGWATYNGDHMSMYGVNAGIPKTLVRALVGFEADRLGGEIADILKDIIATPVSPELLPASEDSISQKTEDLVGPYELHDFFLYHTVKCGEEPSKIYRLAKIAFEGVFSDETILKWLKTFIRRFFTQQFKRSCLPDGPKVCEISLSPRGAWLMPSDASANIWLKELENI